MLTWRRLAEQAHPRVKRIPQRAPSGRPGRRRLKPCKRICLLRDPLSPTLALRATSGLSHSALVVK
eukprot:1682158-Alexandrium_andersonii.AAC.1